MKISDETLRETLKRDLDPVRLSPFVKKRILYAADRPARRLPGRFFRRLVTVAGICCLCLVFSLGGLAAVPDLAVRLSSVSADTLALFTPLDESCESSGIRAEVIAALSDGDTALFYLSLTDTTGQNRLDETLEVPELEVSGMDWAYCDHVSMDENGSAILRITAQKFGGKAPSKVTLSLGTILTQRQDEILTNEEYTVADVEDKVPYPAIVYPARRCGYSLTGSDQTPLARQLSDDNLPLLSIQFTRQSKAFPWLTYMASGVVSDNLHILTEIDPEVRYNQAFFYLTDEEGNRLDLPVAVVDRRDSSQEDVKETWRSESLRQEHICALPEDTDPSLVYIALEATSYQHIEGEWTATFRLEPSQNNLLIDCDFDQKPWKMTQVELSPAGISFYGEGEMLESSLQPDFEILMKDGSPLRDYSAASTMVSLEDDGSQRIQVKLLFDQPLDLAQVDRLTVNGQQIWPETN